MTSRLPLSERLVGRMKRPQELMSWSQSKNGKHFYDDRALAYYYFPTQTLDRAEIDLSQGFDPATFDNESAPFIDGLLPAIIRYEEAHGRLDVDVVSWRGVITMLLALSQGNRDRMLLNDALDLVVQKFDGQIFLAQSAASAVAKREELAHKGDVIKKFMYSGFQFEHVATLPKPWGECSREEIEQRYVTGVYSGDDKLEYAILVKGGINDITVALGAETDCVVGDKNAENKLANYLELKTTKVIGDRHEARKFEKKLLRTWIQSFLSGVPRVAYGFRDDRFRLRAVEEYSVAQLPAMVARSQCTDPPHRWSGHDVVQFYAILMRWLVDRVEEGKTYTLQFYPQAADLVLKQEPITVEGRHTGFLTNEFVEWRRTLKQTAGSAVLAEPEVFGEQQAPKQADAGPAAVGSEATEFPAS